MSALNHVRWPFLRFIASVVSTKFCHRKTLNDFQGECPVRQILQLAMDILCIRIKMGSFTACLYSRGLCCGLYAYMYDCMYIRMVVACRLTVSEWKGGSPRHQASRQAVWSMTSRQALLKHWALSKHWSMTSRQAILSWHQGVTCSELCLWSVGSVGKAAEALHGGFCQQLLGARMFTA